MSMIVDSLLRDELNELAFIIIAHAEIKLPLLQLLSTVHWNGTLVSTRPLIRWTVKRCGKSCSITEHQGI